eukprot:Opistho-2@44659
MWTVPSTLTLIPTSLSQSLSPPFAESRRVCVALLAAGLLVCFVPLFLSLNCVCGVFARLIVRTVAIILFSSSSCVVVRVLSRVFHLPLVFFCLFGCCVFVALGAFWLQSVE